MTKADRITTSHVKEQDPPSITELSLQEEEIEDVDLVLDVQELIAGLLIQTKLTTVLMITIITPLVKLINEMLITMGTI